ncbi:MAG: hypothetical protein ACRC1W_08835 [Shewanella sp.]
MAKIAVAPTNQVSAISTENAGYNAARVLIAKKTQFECISLI